jgi:hypothetical protein
VRDADHSARPDPIENGADAGAEILRFIPEDRRNDEIQREDRVGAAVVEGLAFVLHLTRGDLRSIAATTRRDRREVEGGAPASRKRLRPAMRQAQPGATRAVSGWRWRFVEEAIECHALMCVMYTLRCGAELPRAETDEGRSSISSAARRETTTS